VSSNQLVLVVVLSTKSLLLVIVLLVNRSLLLVVASAALAPHSLLPMIVEAYSGRARLLRTRILVVSSNQLVLVAALLTKSLLLVTVLSVNRLQLLGASLQPLLAVVLAHSLWSRAKHHKKKKASRYPFPLKVRLNDLKESHSSQIDHMSHCAGRD
jgi:hypothetical protein